MDGLKELAEVLQSVSGDAKTVLLWWLAWKLTVALLASTLIGGALFGAYKLIRCAVLNVTLIGRIISTFTGDSYITQNHVTAIFGTLSAHVDEFKEKLRKAQGYGY